MAKKSFKKTSALDILAGQITSPKEVETEKKVASKLKDKIIDSIRIYEEFKELIAPLSEEEIIRLENNILQEGIRDPLILWKSEDEYVLIDGHNRYAIAKKHGLEFPYKTMEFKDKEEVEIWMVNNQLGRRNITSIQRKYLLGQKYETEKRMYGTNRFTMLLEEEETKGKTKKKIAQEENISESTVMRAAKLYQAINTIAAQNKDIRNKLLTYETSSKNIEKLSQIIQKESLPQEVKNQCRELIISSSSLEEVLKQIRPAIPTTKKEKKNQKLSIEEFEQGKKEIIELTEKLQKQSKLQTNTTQNLLKQLEKSIKKLRIKLS